MNIFKRILSTDIRATPPTSAPIASNQAAEPTIIAAIPSMPTDADTSAREQVDAAIAHDRQCTLTIGEAQDLFRTKLRRPLSARSLQRYCQSGTIAAQMITHSTGKEWLLNEPSLIKFIERYPITLTEATPGATETADIQPTPATKTNPVADTTPDSQATAPAATAPSPDTKTDKPTPPILHTATPSDGEPSVADNGAADEYASDDDAGEKRRLADILIENARLTALLKGKDETIRVLERHDSYLREELTKATNQTHKLTDKMASISEKTLDTMAAIGTAGKTVYIGRGDEEEGDDRQARRRAN